MANKIFKEKVNKKVQELFQVLKEEYPECEFMTASYYKGEDADRSRVFISSHERGVWATDRDYIEPDEDEDDETDCISWSGHFEEVE